MSPTPIIVFAYNRPIHLERALKALENCSRLAECDIYIYCDGPKPGADATPVIATRQVAHSWAQQWQARVVEQETNIGLAHSIVSGVTELCDRYGRIIVLEDDLIVNRGFVDYMLQALDRYNDTSKVYQISGHMFPVTHTTRYDAVFLPFITSWGWATWRRAWQHFDWNASGSARMLNDPAIRRRFDLDGSYPYATMLEQRLAGRNESWDILWWWCVFHLEGVVLHPREAFVWVGGFDGTGTHCPNDPTMPKNPDDKFMKRAFSGKIDFPEHLLVDSAAFNSIKVYHSRGTSLHSGSFSRKILRRLKKFYTMAKIKYIEKPS